MVRLVRSKVTRSTFSGKWKKGCVCLIKYVKYVSQNVAYSVVNRRLRNLYNTLKNPWTHGQVNEDDWIQKELVREFLNVCRVLFVSNHLNQIVELNISQYKIAMNFAIWSSTVNNFKEFIES